MCDDQDMEEILRTVHLHPRKLTDIAAVSFVAALLNHKLKHMRKNKVYKSNINALNLTGISIPNALQAMISKLEDNMQKAITRWWAHHYTCTFFKDPWHDSMIDWLDQLIWLSDGTIDYVQTAKKMLDNDTNFITNVQKLQLACEYSFVDIVERLKKKLTRVEIKKAVEECNDCDDVFLKYWYRRANRRHFSQTDDLIKCICFEIIYPDYYTNTQSFKYFFNQLSNEKRMSIISDTIRDYNPGFYRTYALLLSMTGTELNYILKERSVPVMYPLLKKRRYLKHTMLLWKRMVHIIDDTDLAKIINDVNTNQSYEWERSYVNHVLSELWFAISERQKKYIIDKRICDFDEDSLDFEKNFYFSPNFPLILDFLSYCDSERKYEYWSKNWPYLVVGQLDHRDAIDRIMQLCMTNDQQVDAFKSTTMIGLDTILPYCRKLIYNGRIEEVSMYLEFCTSDRQVIRDLKRRILKHTSTKDVFNGLFLNRLDARKLEVFDRYVADIFCENGSKEYLNKVFSRPENMKKMYKIHFPGRFQEMVRLIERFVSSEEILKKIKLYFFERSHVCRTCQGCPCNSDAYNRKKKLDRSVILDITFWCFNVDKVLAEEFKAMPPAISVKDRNDDDDKKHFSVFETFMDTFKLSRFG